MHVRLQHEWLRVVKDTECEVIFAVCRNLLMAVQVHKVWIIYSNNAVHMHTAIYLPMSKTSREGTGMLMVTAGGGHGGDGAE